MVDLSSNIPVNERDCRTREWLAKLQGNILRGHGRDFGVYIFFSFGKATEKVCRQTIRELADKYVTPADQQFDDTVLYRRTGFPGPMFGNLFLTRRGYERLGFDPECHFKEPKEPEPEPIDPSASFLGGMQTAAGEFGDPPVREWDEGYQHELHGMLLLADDDEAELARTALPIVRALNATHTVYRAERGRALRNENGDGIEHFGYVDGRSQPLFLLDDFRIGPENEVPPVLTGERDGGTIDQWNPYEPLKRVLIRDPFGPDDECLGSYLVFRKLEQDVRGFCARVEEVADALGFKGRDRERAGAMIVGRFRDGTPVSLSPTSGWYPVEDNDFTFFQDRHGARCPLHAHIRKVNPRGDTLKESEPLDDRERRITRRSITYGRRSPVPAAFEPSPALPSRDVGLLFMCFQASIRRQFAFIQKRWCNDKHFLVSNTGIDALVGQGLDSGSPQHWNAQYNNRETIPFDFHGFVRMKGGEFFFAPSLPFLRRL